MIFNSFFFCIYSRQLEKIKSHHKLEEASTFPMCTYDATHSIHTKISVFANNKSHRQINWYLIQDISAFFQFVKEMR